MVIRLEQWIGSMKVQLLHFFLQVDPCVLLLVVQDSLEVFYFFRRCFTSALAMGWRQDKTGQGSISIGSVRLGQVTGWVLR